MSSDGSKRPNDPGYSASHIGKGDECQKAFCEQAGRRLIWQLEQDFLEALCDRLPRSFHLLDFACGTGRIAGFIADQGGRVHGIDISESMIEVARETVNNGVFVCSDFREAEGMDSLKEDYALITAFRFFSNAEESLRKDALGFVHRSLGKDGVAVINIHRNCASMGFRLQKLARKPSAQRCYSPSDFEILVAGAGLVVTSRISQGFLVLSDKRIILPPKFQFTIERLLQRSFLKRTLLGFNVIYTLSLADA